ncbi:DUF5723 family protein [Pedobacter sp. MW01-1-1]|uniref:DUF5723 family protein n=1 Tax=Pedobacter sp. MW01-1-1 TaxID=3383027 RepID=UPI003FEFFA02
MKKLLIALLAILIFHSTKAQQFALFGTHTQFDSFENPAQRSFTLDSSRKFASNFLLPNFGINLTNQGDTEPALRKMVQEGIYDTRGLHVGDGKLNYFNGNVNVYLATFRIFKSYQHQQEMGFSWQVRSDINLDYTNEVLAIFESYNRFPVGQYLEKIFDSKGQEQSYHQFSFSYRENYNKRLSFGLKASLLSGILYNRILINNSHLYIDPDGNYMDIGFDGNYWANFSQNNEIDKQTLMPTFKNPGLSFSFGTSYTTKNGINLMANLKDLGFIWWRSQTSQTAINTSKTIEDLEGNQSQTNQEITDIFYTSAQPNKFFAATNAKIDVYASKQFGFYQPALIASKNLFYRGGDISFVNTFKYFNYSASLSPTYNFNKIFMMGVQAKYQNPNFELYLGSDDLTGTSKQMWGIIKEDATIGDGPNGTSFYMGIGIKFGRTVNHPQFADMMPGINDESTGFFGNLFRKKKR